MSEGVGRVEWIDGRVLEGVFRNGYLNGCCTTKSNTGGQDFCVCQYRAIDALFLVSLLCLNLSIHTFFLIAFWPVLCVPLAFSSLFFVILYVILVLLHS